MVLGPLLFGHSLALLLASYVAVAAIAIALYETARGLVKRTLNRRLEKNLREFFESPDLYRQRFKFTNKLVIKHQLLGDGVLNEEILAHASEQDQDVERVRKRVEAYIEEIVPAFNLFTYYRIGYPLARMVSGSLYDCVVDQATRHVIEELGENAAPVFVVNHRSNFDYVLLSYMLAGKVSISYAVGEWARVWPLEALFKSFGSYFVRRGYKEPLYHKVLERYVQLIAHNGVTQAVFPEGGLTRDGLLRAPKLGLLTWLARLEADPEFKRELVFVPIGVNYDRVIEDRNLVKEAQGIRRKAGFWKKLAMALVMPLQALVIVTTNGARFLAGERKLHGHASISFGEAVPLKQWMSARGVDYAACSRAERRRHIQEFGEDLIRHIGTAIPATPVTLLAVTLLDHPGRQWSTKELVSATAKTRNELQERGVRIVTGSAFARFRSALIDHTPQASGRRRTVQLQEVDAAFSDQEETEEYVRFALRLLRRYNMVKKKRNRWTVRENREARLRYYANSLAHHLGRSWPITTATGSPARDDVHSAPTGEEETPLGPVPGSG